MRRRWGFLISLALVASTLSATQSAWATGGTLDYKYLLDGSRSSYSNRGVGPVFSISEDHNSADTNGCTHDGIHHKETITGVQYGSGHVTCNLHGKPSSGNTINVSAGSAVGVAVHMRFASGTRCRSDSANVTQIGAFSDNTTQLKIQQMDCGEDSQHPALVSADCRIAGQRDTGSGDPPIAPGDNPLNGSWGTVYCWVSRYDFSGLDHNKPVLNMLVHPDGAANNTHGNTGFPWSAYTGTGSPGAFASKAALSVGNKCTGAGCPRAAPSTDQFNGDIDGVAYCEAGAIKGTGGDDVLSCLTSALPPVGV